MDKLPDDLLALSPDAKLNVLRRMKALNRNARGANLVNGLRPLPSRSAQSVSSEFFARRHAGAYVHRHASPDEVQIQAEADRIRGGHNALLAKPPPATGGWTNARHPLPRSGWKLLRIEDTGLTDGAVCEVCEKAQMRYSYVLRHIAWPLPPAEAGQDVHGCRLCAAHLLGGQADLKPRRTVARVVRKAVIDLRAVSSGRRRRRGAVQT